MSQYKKQHYIPQCYLKSWCDESTPKHQTPYVWQFSKNTRESKKKSPQNIFFENDMYTIKNADGSKNFTLEKGLSELETKFSKLRTEKLQNRIPINLEEHILLCAFIAAMHSRTKAQLIHQKTQWQKPLEIMESMMEQAAHSTPEQIKNMSLFTSPSEHKNSFGYEEIKNVVDKPMQHLLSPMISVLTPHFLNLDIIIFETDSSPGFITSDNPCFWFDPEAYKRPPMFQNPGLMYETIEIHFPISPRQLLVFNRLGLKGCQKISKQFVTEENRKAVLHSHEYFIVNKNYKNDLWFYEATGPRDAWEKISKEEI